MLNTYDYASHSEHSAITPASMPPSSHINADFMSPTELATKLANSHKQITSGDTISAAKVMSQLSAKYHLS